jgi:SAM-dependent methyltransferase
MVRSTEMNFKGGRGAPGLILLAAIMLCTPLDASPQGLELDTPYVPTPQVVVDRMLDLAQVRSGDRVIDLGSGDGRIMITAARKYGARGFGVEIDPRLVKLSNEEARRAGLADRVKFLQQDLFKTELRDADVLTLYLLPDVNLALRPKILAELRPGSRVVSHDYGMREWRPDAEESLAAPDKRVGAHKESTVYLWIVPAQVAGRWELEIKSGGGVRRMRLVLRQQFQIVSGSVEMPKHGGAPVFDARLRGEALRFSLPGGVIGRDPVELVGRVAGDSLGGSVRRGEREIGVWSAQKRS